MCLVLERKCAWCLNENVLGAWFVVRGWGKRQKADTRRTRFAPFRGGGDLMKSGERGENEEDSGFTAVRLCCAYPRGSRLLIDMQSLCQRGSGRWGVQGGGTEGNVLHIWKVFAHWLQGGAASAGSWCFVLGSWFFLV